MKLLYHNLPKSFKYFLFVVPIVPITILTLDYIEKSIGFHTWVYSGDIDAFMLIIVLGTLSYWIGNRILYKDSTRYKNFLQQHLIQSFINYFMSVALFILLLISYRTFIGSLGYGLLTILFISIVWGIIINLFYILMSSSCERVGSQGKSD